MTNRELLRKHTELENSKESIFYELNQSKIREWYGKHGGRLNTLFEKMKRLHAKYFELDDKGRIVHEEIMVNEKPVRKRKFLEGVSEEEYNNEREELMNGGFDMPVIHKIKTFN